jgi:hypothetical protein
MIKNLLLLPLALLIINNTAVGQAEKMLFGKETSYQLSRDYSISKTYNSDNSKQLLFYDGFEEYGDILNPEIWEIKRSTDTTAFDLANASTPMWFLCKPSNFNGNGSNYIQTGTRSAAISYLAPNATWLVTKESTSIDSEGLTLNFWLYYVNNPDNGINTSFYVMISEAELNEWKSIGKWDEDSPSNQFNEIVSLEIPDEFSGKDIQVAFVYVNNDNEGFQLAIDNVYIGSLTNPDLKISAYHYPYSMVPMALLNTFDYSIKAYVNNMGANYQSEGATAKVGIEQVENFETTLNIDFPIETGETKFINFPDKPVFSVQGNYVLVYKIDQDYSSKADQNKSSNAFTFKVTPSTLATDYCATLGVSGGFSPGKNIPFGNKYMVNEDVLVSGIQIQWPSFTTSETFAVQIYEVSPIDSSLLFLYEKNITRATDKSSTTANYNIDPIYLMKGADFFIAVKQLENTSLNVGFDKVPNGQFWRLRNGKLELLSNPAFGNIAVRMLLSEPTDNPSISFTVTDGEIPISGATIEFESESESISTDEKGEAQIAFPNGMYTFTISKEGFAPYTEQVLLNYSNLVREITLLPEYTASFTIETNDDDAVPLAGAEILISNLTGTTDNNGVAEFKLAKGFYSFTVLLEGYEPVTSEFDLIENINLSVPLTEAVTFKIDFAIVAEHNEMGIENVKVDLSGYGSKFTNTQGEVTFTGILPATNGIIYTLSKDGYSSVSRTTIPIIDESIVVNDTLEIITFYISIEVKNDNSVVEGATVTLGSNSKNTNIFGVAVFEGVIPQGDISLKILKTGYLPVDTTLSLYNSNLRLTYGIEIEPSSSNPLLINPFKVFPNPSKGVFKIQGEGEYKIEVIDVLGRLIMARKSSSAITPIDISNQPKGIYYVRLTQNKEAHTFRIIVN